MKTFTEQNNCSPFDWNNALSQKKINLETWDYLGDLASQWVTCACGNQCASIPRKRLSGAPEDELLRELGMAFHSAILFKRKPRAVTILREIEQRSTELIQQLSLNT